MRKPVIRAVCLALALQASTLPTFSAATSEPPSRAAAEPVRNAVRPEPDPLRCVHPLSGQELTARDCAALLSMLLMGALGSPSGADNLVLPPAGPSAESR